MPTNFQYYLSSMNDKKRMRGPKDLAADLKKYQDLYDKADNNPHLQTDLQQKINNCVRQLKLWVSLKKSID